MPLRLLSSKQEDRPALFATQFALSHACWLLFYPLAGWLGARHGMPATFAFLGTAGSLAVWLCANVWPARDPDVIEYRHKAVATGHVHTQVDATDLGGLPTTAGPCWVPAGARRC